MLDFYGWLIENREPRQRYFDFMKTPKVSLKEVKDKKMFGPVYHGTSEEGREGISDTGFKFNVGLPRQGEIANGYELTDYLGGIPAPIHHLGFGVYFTASKNNAKMYNNGTTKGLNGYYIDAPRLETINFGTNNTMMKWWRANGYDMPPLQWGMGSTGAYKGIPTVGKVLSVGQDQQAIQDQWLKSTTNLTNTLKSKYDAVYFKGKGFKKLLDGDQICVYDPNNIYEVDMELDEGEDLGNGVSAKIGDRVVIRGTRATAVIKNMRPIPPQAIMKNDVWGAIAGKSNYFLEMGQWKDPGNDFDKVYRPILIQRIQQLTNQDWFKSRMSNRPDMSLEDHIKSITDYYLADRLNFPSGLAERVLKKGERFK